MKRKKIRGRLASLVAVVLLIALMAVPVCAASAYTALTGVTGGDDGLSFDKYLVVDEDTNIPAAVFNFTVRAGEGVKPLTTGELEVFPGPDAGNIVIGTNGSTTFAAGQATTAGTANDGIVNDTAKRYAKNVVAIDISAVSFTHPGVYRYIITETAQAAGSAFTNDTVTTRTLDVYIQDNGGALEFQGYVIYSGTVATAPKTEATDAGEIPNGAEATGATKSDKYINTYTTYDLTAGKQVTGNQGSKDKYFKFTIKLTETAAVLIDKDNLYTVDLTGCETAPDPTDSTSYTTMTQPADTDGNNANGIQVKGSTLKAGMDVYLKDGQYVKVLGIPAGVTYEVTEADEKYISTASSAANPVTYNNIDATDSTSGTLSADKVVGFKNSKDGVIPTGILMSATPWIIIGVVVVAGIVFFAIRSKKKYEEE